MTRNQPYFVETTLSGYELLNDPLLNKGTAFTDSERDLFELHGLLPPHVTELDYQVTRRLDAFRTLSSNLQKYVFLRGLQDTNETLFYALLTRNIAGKFWMVSLTEEHGGPGYLALWQKCPHLGCTVPWVGKEQKFICPCHLGMFSAHGTLLGGPPPRNMDRLESKVEGGILKIQYQFFRQLVRDKEELA